MYEFDTDYVFVLRTIARVSVAVRADITVLYHNGKLGTIGLNVTTNADGSTVVGDTSAGVSRRGKVTGLHIRSPTTTRRGQLYFTLRMGISGTAVRQISLASGYLEGEFHPGLGYFESPRAGSGYLHWVQETDDAAGNATTTVNLTQANTHRIVRGVVVKYHADTNAATRTITVTLRDLATAAGPTGWTIASDTYVSPTLTLTLSEEGLIHIGEHGFVSTNDAGVLAYADSSTNPNPFPLEIEADETADLIIAAGAGLAGDDYDVWVQYEDWIEV